MIHTNAASSTKHGRTFGVLVALAGVCLFATAIGPAQQVTATPGLVALADSTMPVSVDNLGITQDYVKNLSSLDYLATNRSRETISDFVLAVTEFGGSGKVLGGEELTVRADLRPGASRGVRSELSHFVPFPLEGERVVVAVLRADSPQRAWTVRHSAYRLAAAETSAGSPSDLVAQQTAQPATSPSIIIDCSGFCGTRLTNATNSCSGGIKSYSCGANSAGTGCDCSFTCK
jgi:hypothetical protein